MTRAWELNILAAIAMAFVSMTPDPATAGDHIVQKAQDMKFKYTILYVDNVQNTLSFYYRAFGMQARMVHESGDYAEMDTGDTALAFISRDFLTKMGKSSGQPSLSHPAFEIAFEVEDVQAAYEKAVAAGAAPVSPPAEMPWGQTISYVADPNGFMIEICSVMTGP
jgi:uncharacterized glyoxalase superfamily protein PhnB